MANLRETFGLFGPLHFSTSKQPQSVTGKKSGKSTISLLVLLAICFSALPAQAKYGGGSGTADDPYLIYTAEEMNAIGANGSDWDKHFKLMADIDLADYTGASLNIIGYFASYDDNKPFTGVFDGNDCTISNFTCTSYDSDYIGLFGYVTGVIKNLGLIKPDIDAGTRYDVGSLAGHLENGTITDCYAEAVSVSGGNAVGGLVGFNAGRIVNCYSSGRVWGDIFVAGLVGQVGAGTVIKCYSNASASGNRNVGGCVGKTAEETSAVTHCYAAGRVTGDTYVGGMAGQVERGAVYQCYSTGSVSGNHDAGGLVGYTRVLGKVVHSFWDTQTSGQLTSAGGTGKTTAEMQMVSTFTSAGWDFWNIWEICEGMNYPVLQWQIPFEDFRCPDGVSFIDFAFFAAHWHHRHCNPSNNYCDGTDLDQSGSVGFLDLAIFADNWLAGVRN